MELKLTAAQTTAKRDLGKLERRIARTNKTQAKRKADVVKLKTRLKG